MQKRAFITGITCGTSTDRTGANSRRRTMTRSTASSGAPTINRSWIDDLRPAPVDLLIGDYAKSPHPPWPGAANTDEGIGRIEGGRGSRRQRFADINRTCHRTAYSTSCIIINS